MIILFLLLITIALLILLLFTVASRIEFHFDSAAARFKLAILWLYPFLKAEVSSEDSGYTLQLFLFNKRILKRIMNVNKKISGNMYDIQRLHPTNIAIKAQYGFQDPYFTGMFCTVISMISQFFSVDSLSQQPDFLAFDTYINIDATARLNLGRSLLALV